MWGIHTHETANEESLDNAPYSDFPALVRADLLHDQGITGRGVSIAVVDTGLWSWRSLVNDSQGAPRLGVRYDAIRDEKHFGGDGHGHGSHVASVALDSQSVDGRFNGIAPDAGFVAVKAFDDNGQGSYANVISRARLDPEQRQRLQHRRCQHCRSVPNRSPTTGTTR